jgi:ribosomal-protein-alanine N-acetyltransferase
MRWWQTDRVLAIERVVFASSAWSSEQLLAELAGVPGTRHYVVAIDDEDVVGYAGMAVNGDTADVMTVAVATERQRQGAGRALVEALLAHAGSRGVQEVFLEVLVENEPAIGLYSALGFDRIARRRDYYGPGADGLVMRLRLSRQGQWAPS